MRVPEPSPSPHYRRDGQSIAAFAATFAVSLAVYLRTLSPSIAGGDAGELVAEGCALGTAHPPGYPLYTILVHLAVKAGRRVNADVAPAYWANAMSAVFGAAASGLITSCVQILTHASKGPKRDKDGGGRKIAKDENRKASEKDPMSSYDNSLVALSASVSAGLLHSFSPLAWQYATTAEVFALHNLFVALIVHACVRYHTRRADSTAVQGALLCGLALTNQHTSVLLEIPAILWVVWRGGLHRRPSILFRAAAAFLLGLGLYAALPYLAATRPHAGSWGDVTTLRGLWHHLLRRDYGTFRLYSGERAGSEGMVEQTLAWFIDFVARQCGSPIAVALFLWGCIVLVSGEGPDPQSGAVDHEKKSKCKPKSKLQRSAGGEETESARLAALLLGSMVFYLSIFHSLSNLPLSDPLLFGVHQRFWMHPNVLAFIVIGMGARSLGNRSVTHFSESFPLSICGVGALPFSAVVLGMAAQSCLSSFASCDQSDNYHFRNYALAVLDPLPPDSLLFVNYDQQWTSIRYLQECEGVRRDVTSINLSMMSYSWWETKRHLYPHISFPGTHYTLGNTHQWLDGGFTFAELMDANHDSFGGQIYTSGNLNYDDPDYRHKYEDVPHGLVRRTTQRGDVGGKQNSVEEYRHASLKAWGIISERHSSLTGGLPDERKYPHETWEWTIRREYLNHAAERASYLLESAIEVAAASEGKGRRPTVLPSLTEAAAWIEAVRTLDPNISGVSPALAKNLGLAYLHMVRNTEPRWEVQLPNISLDVFSVANSDDIGGMTAWRSERWWDPDAMSEDWKTWASRRWNETWGEFLRMEGAKGDPSYDKIKSIYDSVVGVANRRQ